MQNPDVKTPNYQFTDGKLHIMSRDGLVTYDGHRATISNAFGGKTLLVLAVVIGYLPIIACINIVAGALESRGGLVDIIFPILIFVFIVGAAIRMLSKIKEAVRAGLYGSMPAADIGNPAYKAQLHAIYQRESRKAQNQAVGSAFIQKLLRWFMLAVVGILGTAGFLGSAMHLMSAIEHSKNQAKTRAEQHESPAVREERLLKKLSGLPDTQTNLHQRAHLNENLGAVEVHKGDLKAAEKYYRAALQLHLQQLDTTNNGESVVKSAGKCAVYLAETMVATDGQVDLLPLTRQLLDGVADSCRRRNMAAYPLQRTMTRQITKTLKHRKYKDKADYTNQALDRINAQADNEKRVGLEKLLNELLDTIKQPSS